MKKEYRRAKSILGPLSVVILNRVTALLGAIVLTLSPALLTAQVSTKKQTESPLIVDMGTYKVSAPPGGGWQIDTEIDRIKTQRLISGLGLAVSWAGTVLIDLLVQDGYRGSTVVPVIGPWITLARMARNHDRGWPGAKGLLILSGLAQTGLATYFVISLASHPKSKETKDLAICANLNSINLRIQF